MWKGVLARKPFAELQRMPHKPQKVKISDKFLLLNSYDGL
ncbi:uncharacterized protein METZ01_LOCUS179931 [marine metagenome]|uniref:Uncharacterized protein n=1 Tax=marine metagenome TaxID=408172 RepID=A0A382CP62_9ZZZZ